MSSLFANLNNPQKSEFGGIFGASNSSTTTPATTATQPSTSTSAFPSLFGSAAAGTSTEPTTLGTSSLFSSTAKSAKPSLSTPFSITSTTQAQPVATATGSYELGNSSFSSKTATVTNMQASQTPSQNTAYFDSILDKSRKRAYPDAASNDLPQLQLGLGDLRQRIKKIGTGAGPDRSAEAHYLLAASGVKPGDAIRDLNEFAAARGKIERVQPHEQPDTDIETYITNLQTQTTLSMIQDGLARSVRDFDAFLEENVTMEWDAQRKRIYEHFGIRPKDYIPPGGRGSFAESKRENRGGFGRSRRSKTDAASGSRALGRDSVLGRSAMHKSVIGAAGPLGSGHEPVFPDVKTQMEKNHIVVAGPHDRLQRDKQNRYAEKVTALNSARLQKQPYPICSEFLEVVNGAGDTHGPDLSKAYRTLSEIVGENPDITSLADPRLPKERQFVAAYLDVAPVRQSVTLKKAILQGGTQCLEKLAFEHMEEIVAKNPREANLGGIPNVVNKVKAYVRLQASRKNLAGDNTDLQMLGDDYVWALIYNLLRTGHVQEANEYVKSNAAAFRAIDRGFATYIHAYANDDDRRLGGDLQTRINSEYNQRLRIAPENSIDPYRMACYKIIGRCDLRQRHLETIPQNVEDFVWVQLVLAREINRVDVMASEVYGLTEVQNMIKEIGNRFFAKGGSEIGSSFGAFVFLQIAVGLFEDAVSYLYSYSYIDGVHLAIALAFYGLLRVSDPSTAGDNLLSLTTRNQAQISFGPMIGLYTRDFRAADVAAAVDYLVLICINQDIPGSNGTNQVALCHEALRELVLESREFADLLGDIRGDGQRLEGLIERRLKLIGLEEAGDFYRTITLHAASQADDNGRVSDAVLLYHLAGEYDNVVTTLNRALAQVVSVPLGQSYDRLVPIRSRTTAMDLSEEGTSFSLSTSDDPVEMAASISTMYASNPVYMSKVKPVNIAACAKLQSVQAAKECVERGQWTTALDIINELQIIPLSTNGDANAIRNLANAFASLPQPLAASVPNLLLWSITCSTRQRNALTTSLYGGNEGTRLQMVEQMRQINMDLMTFVGQLRYRLPASLHETLARAQGF